MTQHEINARINELNAQAEALLGKLRGRYGDLPRREVVESDQLQQKRLELSAVVAETLESFKCGSDCPHSMVFDQLSGEFCADRCSRIAVDSILIPLCKAASILDEAKQSSGKRPCPFYHDVDPRDEATRYQIGDVSSHHCDYYNYLAANGPIPRIVNHLSAWVVEGEPEPIQVNQDAERIRA